MTAILAATIMWCLDHADDNPASDCGLLEREVKCIEVCTGDDEGPEDDCPAQCITRARVKQIVKFPLYQGKGG